MCVYVREGGEREREKERGGIEREKERGSGGIFSTLLATCRPSLTGTNDALSVP